MGNQFSLIKLFTGGDLMITAISVLLVVGSVISWVIIVEKLRLWNAEKHRPTKLKADDKNMMLTIDRAVVSFDKNLWFLSMSSVVAPFIGLFGTVWGVMDSFSAIGVTQSAALGVIAPGLAAALGTTALGLIVAIPATIAYQYFAKRSDDFYNKLDDARREFESRK
ncbi:MAG: MotA/TolQ/ExbB proton channel family protein [Alphaproteobacteria bacterium]|nr:MotA/TolQ/ExbB proton channel family protein [Alphaproteobacteria bacterium]MCL2889703.1 MotA/TolQ/ExbB proton channel family protein [Alphaproteobacteria bacterium]